MFLRRDFEQENLSKMVSNFEGHFAGRKIINQLKFVGCTKLELVHIFLWDPNHWRIS